jgi:hypothetical protein
VTIPIRVDFEHALTSINYDQLRVDSNTLDEDCFLLVELQEVPVLSEEPEEPEEPFDDELSDPDFAPDSALAPDSAFELSEPSPDLPFATPPLTAPARLSVR